IAACHYRCLCLPTLPPPTSTLFPYTTLFRSLAAELLHRLGDRLELTLRQRERLGAEEGVLIDRTSTSAPVAREAREQCVGGFDRSEETRLNSSHVKSSYAVFCLKKKTKNQNS